MRKLGEINGLRGIAILSVLFEHLHLGKEPPWMHDQMPQWGALGLKFFAKSVYWNGWLAVNLFFVLSGFVLFLPYAKGSRHMAGWADCSYYYVRRSLRLLPLFSIAVLVSILFVEPFQGSWPALREALFCLSGLFHFTSSYFWPPCNSVLWSLGVEIWFSVLFPLIIMGTVRFGLWKTFGTCVLVALATRLLGVWAPDASQLIHIQPIKDNVFGRVDDFAVGVAVAKLYAQGRFQSKVSLGWSLLGGIACLWVGGILWTLARCELIAPWTRAFYNIPVWLGFGGILLAAINPHLPKLLGLVLRNSFLQLSGAMCFSLYVWHFVIITHFINRSHHPVDVATFFIMTFALAILSYRFIEFGDVKDWRRLLPGN